MDPFRPLLRLLAPLRTARWWPTARALVILLHLVAVTAVACPAPVRSFNARAWKRTSVQAELRGWTDRLGQIGVNVTPLELQAFSQTATTRWTDTRREIVAPFKWWLGKVGAPQGWYMFTGPDREPQRFVLSISTTTTPTLFSQVFSMGDGVTDPALVLPGFIDDHRVRRALFQTSWSNNDDIFRKVCAYFDKRVRARRAGLAAVRCSLVGRLAEHPSQVGRPRPESVAREITIAVDGAIIESRDGAPPRTTKPPKPAKKKPRSSSSSSSGGGR